MDTLTSSKASHTDVGKPGYFSRTRDDLIHWVSRECRSILDLGCGEGYTGGKLRRLRDGIRVYGVESDRIAALKARQHLNGVVAYDLNRAGLPFRDSAFDCIIAGDVLEHLIRPDNLLLELHRVMSPGGLVIASIPNVRFVRVSANLLFRGHWEYRESGILDVSHLRFFTRRSIIQLFERTGYEVVDCIPRPMIGRTAKWLYKLSFHRLEELLAYGYIVRARSRN